MGLGVGVMLFTSVVDFDPVLVTTDTETSSAVPSNSTSSNTKTRSIQGNKYRMDFNLLTQ